MTTIRQRVRRFLTTLNHYAEALESNPFEILLERMNSLEAEVERLKNSPCAHSRQVSAVDLG